MRFYITLLLLSCCAYSFAQTTLTGRVVENGGSYPIEFATVKVLDATSGDLIGGTATDLEGSFEVEVPQLPVTVAVSFIGFAEKRIENVEDAKLGIITLRADGELLEEVNVVAKRSTTEFKLDKRVFNVGEDLGSSGASALELLNNVPSVTVDIEGQIALRGSSGVQILINGKPSVLASEGGAALGTITADMIEKVEVITNPSAKYDAEGTSGIINIVLKKEEKRGVNGSVTVNTGIPDNHSLGLSINSRTEKWNFFGQFGVGDRRRPFESTSINNSFSTGSVVRTDGTGGRNEKFVNVILGTDYNISDRSIISLKGFYAFEDENNDANTEFEFFEDGINLSDRWRRIEETEADNPKYSYELNFSHQFDPNNKDHQLLLSASGNSFQKDQSSSFSTITTEGTALFGDQQTATNFGENEYTFKADYTQPFTDEWSIEAGAQYNLKDVANDFEVRDLVGGEFVITPELTDRFEWDQGVLAAYGTASYEDDRWGAKLGLRMEHTEVTTLLSSTQEGNDQDYTNVFPSLATSYKITEAVSLQASYSKRIFRPRLWNLNPFFNIQDNFNVRTGNPDLSAEFTDSYELTSIYIFDKWSINFGGYYRFTDDVVENVVFNEGDVNISRPVNLGTTGTTGLELNAKYRPVKWLTLSGDANYNHFNRKATFEGRSLDFTAGQLTGRLVSKWELPADIEIEVSGNAESGVKTIQGNREGFVFMDAGVRKKILKGKVIINAGVRDAFASRLFVNNANQPTFTRRNTRFRGRFLTLGVSYGFGKGEAMEFQGRRRF